MAIQSITRDVTRTNPTAIAIDTVIKTGQMDCFHVVLSNTGGATAIDAAAAQQILEAVGAPVHLAQVENGGLEMLLFMEGHANNVDTVAQNIGALYDTTAKGTVASGVYTIGGAGGTITVTIEDDLFDM